MLVIKRGLVGRKRRIYFLGCLLLSLSALSFVSLGFSTWNIGNGEVNVSFEANAGDVFDFSKYFEVTAFSTSDVDSNYGFVGEDGRYNLKCVFTVHFNFFPSLFYSSDMAKTLGYANGEGKYDRLTSKKFSLGCSMNWDTSFQTLIEGGSWSSTYSCLAINDNPIALVSSQKNQSIESSMVLADFIDASGDFSSRYSLDMSFSFALDLSSLWESIKANFVSTVSSTDFSFNLRFE